MPLTSHEVRFSLPHIEVAGKAWGEPGGLPVIALHGTDPPGRIQRAQWRRRWRAFTW